MKKQTAKQPLIEEEKSEKLQLVGRRKKKLLEVERHRLEIKKKI